MSMYHMSAWPGAHKDQKWVSGSLEVELQSLGVYVCAGYEAQAHRQGRQALNCWGIPHLPGSTGPWIFFSVSLGLCAVLSSTFPSSPCCLGCGTPLPHSTEFLLLLSWLVFLPPSSSPWGNNPGKSILEECSITGNIPSSYLYISNTFQWQFHKTKICYFLAKLAWNPKLFCFLRGEGRKMKDKDSKSEFHSFKSSKALLVEIWSS